MSKKSSSGVIQLSFCDITPHSRLRRDTMPYTDLSYYKLSVYLQVGPVWSGLRGSRLDTESSRLFLSQTVQFHISSLSERQPSSSDCCCRVHVWDKAEG